MALAGIPKQVLLGLASASLVLTVVGCGGASAPTPTGAPAAPTKAPAAEPAKAPAPAEATKPAATAGQPAAAPTRAVGALPKAVSIAGLSAGTSDYGVITGLAKVATDAGPMQVIVQPFSGATAYIPQLSGTGKPEIAFMSAVEAWEAFTGKAQPATLPENMAMAPPFAKASDNLRMLLMGTDLAVGMMVRKDSKYQTISDLKGAKLTFGAKAQPANYLATLANMAMGGLTRDDIAPVDVPDTTAGMRAFTEGRADATAIAPAGGNIAEADSQIGVRFLDTPNDAAKLKLAQSIEPGGKLVDFKAGSTAGITKDIKMWAFSKAVVTSTQLSDDAAYALTKIWWDNYQKLEPLHTQFKGWTPEIYVSKNATLPYHNGAIAFYKEKGVWTAEMEANQQLLLKGELPFLK
jgi:uncharacterized protein